MYKIGLDIGGTRLKFALVDNQKILETKIVSTPKTKLALVKTIVETTAELTNGLSKSKIIGLGIGVPGPLNKKRDLILNPPNLIYLKNTCLAQLVQQRLRIKVKMENDANCFALGEALLGAGRGSNSVFAITLGTGVGGGFIVNGKIFEGSFGAAGEIGHVIIKADQKLKELEDYASEKFVKREGNTTSDKLFFQAKHGNKKAVVIFQELGHNLGIGLANVINLIDPEVVVVGGGLVGAWQFISKPLQGSVKKFVISSISRKYVKIKKAELGEFSGALGASQLIK
ncbi:MAG: ROK family protein [Candidatus Nealsonbacteria bacterium]